MRVRHTFVVALTVTAACRTQQVAITTTICTDNQMHGYWTTDTGSTVPGHWNSLIVTTESLTQGQFGDFAFLVLSAGSLGCGIPLSAVGLGPSCQGVSNDIPGPLIADLSSLILLDVVVPVWGMWSNHHLTIPMVALPAVGTLNWTAQYVIYQLPQWGECWQATGNAIHFSARL